MKIILNARENHEGMLVKCTREGHGGDGCGSILLISGKDIHAADCYEVGGGIEFSHFCPVCGKWSDIHEEIPMEVYKDIEMPKSYIDRMKLL